MYCPLCGAVEETGVNFVPECVVVEGVRKQFGVTWEEIFLFREKVERSIALLDEKWTEKCKDLHTSSAGTVAHTGADKKARP